MEKKFEMGPLQKLWVKSLKAHPERRAEGALGGGNPKKYRACCLGELHLCAYRLKKKKLPFTEYGVILDNVDEHHLANNFENYGLRSPSGNFADGYMLNYKGSLSAANDSGVPWSEIASFIENNPEAVFTHPV